MGEHRKLKRARGLSVRPGGGSRQRSGLLNDGSTPRELNRAARKAVRGVARRRALLATIGAILIIAASVIVSLAVHRRTPETGINTVTPSESGSSVLVVVTDPDGNAVSLALIGVDTQQATVALFPPALLTVLPGFGDRVVSDVSRFGDPALPALTVSNLLGVRVDATIRVATDDLISMIGSDLTVDLASQLVVANGSAEVVAMDVGSAARPPDQVARLLEDQGVGTQLQWLDRQGSVWKALLEDMASNRTLVASLLGRAIGDSAAAETTLVGAATADDLQMTAVPVERIERAGGDSELYQMNGDAATAFAAERFSYLLFTTGARPRVEVLNGNGRIGTTRPVAAALIEHGFRVVRTDNADADNYDVTQIVAQGRDNQQAALDARDVLGRGDVFVEVRQPSGVVDITIIVGQDIPAQEA
jgi:hypothetical protein